MNNFKALVDWLKQAITDHEQFHLGYADDPAMPSFDKAVYNAKAKATS